MITQVSGKVLIWLKKVSFIQKLPKKQSWELSKVELWAKPNMQFCLHKTFKFGTSAQLICLIFLLKTGEKFGSYGKCQKIEV